MRGTTSLQELLMQQPMPPRGAEPTATPKVIEIKKERSQKPFYAGICEKILELLQAS
jgi:hypothetical protein